MRKNKVKLLISILVVLAILLMTTIAIVIVGKNRMDEVSTKVQDLQAEITDHQKIVYVASADILAGETLLEGVNIFKERIYTGLSEDYYMQEEDMGSIARVDIPYGEPITQSEITVLNIDEDSREYEISVAALMVDQMEYDYVDVRIMFPNGEDYTVLAKKPVMNLLMDTSVFYTYMNEDEIMRMASAIIDAYTITGTRIYTTRYVESNLQRSATPNYIVRAETLDIINKDPNIIKIATETLSLQARMDLEYRLSSLTEDQLKAVSEGHALEDTAKSSVLLGGNFTNQTPEDSYNTFTPYNRSQTLSNDDLSTSRVVETDYGYGMQSTPEPTIAPALDLPPDPAAAVETPPITPTATPNSEVIE